MHVRTAFITFCLLWGHADFLFSQQLPDILVNKAMTDRYYLPDFSYAGYHFGEKEMPRQTVNIVKVEDYGVVPNDGKDDSKALIKVMDSLKNLKEAVVVQLPKGRVILSDFLFIERSNLVIRGHGTGNGGTEIYCPRPMSYFKDPEALAELREYLIKNDKRQKEKDNNIDLPFSQYSWSGGMLWTQVPGERVKYYLSKYDVPINTLAKVSAGNMGKHVLTVDTTEKLKLGDVVELQLFNKLGEKGPLLKNLYQNDTLTMGSHHWNFPDLPLVRQQVKIIAIQGKKITIKTPITLTIKPEYEARLVEWKHLEEVGLEHFSITFPKSPTIAHHVEQGYNGIFLTRVYNSWVKNVTIENADSGILTEEIANVTLENIVTQGENIAHYSVAMAGVHNVLVNNLKVYNTVRHPLSFNTFSTKNVYKDCEVLIAPKLDQHSGANHQNLFDNIKVHLKPEGNGSYPLFEGGGAKYWSPFHGPYSTFWNIEVKILELPPKQTSLVLNGMQKGPQARVIGIHGDLPISIEYGPDAYIERTNVSMDDVPSLYHYQLRKRIGTK